MQIVIDLPEKTIAHIRSEYGHGKGFYPLNEEDKKIVNDAIYFGIPLPKGHGRLIDADALEKDADYSNYDGYYHAYSTESIYNAPTIIEAENK